MLDSDKFFELIRNKKSELIQMCYNIQKELSVDNHELDVQMAINELKQKDFVQLTEHMIDLEWADPKELYYLMEFKK